MPRTLNVEQFAAETGGVTEHDVQSHIHAGLRSRPSTKTYARWFDRTFDALRRRRDETEAAYEAAVAAGQIARPAAATLEDRAAGHPDNASTAAAQRLLAKKAARLALAGDPTKEVAKDAG